MGKFKCKVSVECVLPELQAQRKFLCNFKGFISTVNIKVTSVFDQMKKKSVDVDEDCCDIGH